MRKAIFICSLLYATCLYSGEITNKVIYRSEKLLELRDRLATNSYIVRTNVAIELIQNYAEQDVETKVNIIHFLSDKSLFNDIIDENISVRNFFLDHYCIESNKDLINALAQGLFVFKKPTDIENKRIEEVVKKDRWDALQFALLWENNNLISYVKSQLEMKGTNYWQSQHMIYVIPFNHIKNNIPKVPIKKQTLFWLKMQCDLWPEKVYARDLAITYLANNGDIIARSYLVNNYEKAINPKSNRKAQDKDKRYWFVLLCLTGHYPETFPDVPVKEE